MVLPVEKQALYWGIAAAVFFVALWVMGDIILPFVLGGAIAYCLDPIADRLEALGLSRAVSVTVITLAALLIFVILFLLVFPTLVSQTSALIAAAPGFPARLQDFVDTNFPNLMDDQSVVYRQLTQIAQTIQSKGGALLDGLVSSALGLINVIVLLVVVPVVAFYLLLDWDNMVTRIDDLLPRDHAPTIRGIGKEIDRTLASFIRGQGTVCLVMGTYYAISLMTVGLNFGLVVGFFAGVITFIPYVGALLGGALAIGLAIFQFWGMWGWIAAVAIIFAAGQFIEGNIITPRLVGKSVGLHPVWLIFALSVFGAFFGFVGMLVAVPVAAMMGVLIRFGIERYKESRLYRGHSDGS